MASLLAPPLWSLPVLCAMAYENFISRAVSGKRRPQSAFA